MLRQFLLIAKIVAFASMTSCMVVETKGTSKLVNEDLSGFTANTPMKISGSKFSGPVTINSSLTTSNSKYKDLSVNGSSKVSMTNIDGNLIVNGNAKINESIIKKTSQFSGEAVIVDSDLQDINSGSRKLYLSGSNVRNIRVGNIKSSVVSLKKGTVVKGDIIFSLPDGKVLIEDGAKVDGQIYVDRDGKKEFLEIKIQNSLLSSTTKRMRLDDISKEVNNREVSTKYSK